MAEMCWKRWITKYGLAQSQAEKKVTSAVLFDETMQEALKAYRKNEREINMALKEGRFTFCLQPKTNLLTGQIMGGEAGAATGQLWKYCFSGFISPIMEENGSVIDLIC